MQMRMRENEQQAQEVVREQEEVVVENRAKTVDELVDESLASAQNSLATLIRTDEISTETLKELHHQGEQLRGATVDLDSILHNQAKSERHLQNISSFWWSLVNWFRPEPTREDNTVTFKDTAGIPAVVKAAEARQVSLTNSGVKTMFAPEAQGSDALPAPARQKTRREKIVETNNYLAQMDSVLDGLHEKSLVMNEELTEHNKRLGVLEDKTGEANGKFDDLIKRERRLLGK